MHSFLQRRLYIFSTIIIIILLSIKGSQTKYLINLYDLLSVLFIHSWTENIWYIYRNIILWIVSTIGKKMYWKKMNFFALLFCYPESDYNSLTLCTQNKFQLKNWKKIYSKITDLVFFSIFHNRIVSFFGNRMWSTTKRLSPWLSWTTTTTTESLTKKCNERIINI